jgi:hypothetical protein
VAASALNRPLKEPQDRPAGRETISRDNVTYHPRLAAAAFKPPPLAAMPRRSILNAAAHETLWADIRLACGLVAASCCIGLGLAIGIHFDDILADVRLLVFHAEEPRWLWALVDGL